MLLTSDWIFSNFREICVVLWEALGEALSEVQEFPLALSSKIRFISSSQKSNRL